MVECSVSNRLKKKKNPTVFCPKDHGTYFACYFYPYTVFEPFCHRYTMPDLITSINDTLTLKARHAPVTASILGAQKCS